MTKCDEIEEKMRSVQIQDKHKALRRTSVVALEMTGNKMMELCELKMLDQA